MVEKIKKKDIIILDKPDCHKTPQLLRTGY